MEMYTIIIVDDEWIVREGLKQTIPWEQLNCRLIGEASNGHTALELAREHKPDILLTDIRMPRMDGLELAQQVAAQSVHTKVVFLTGFDEFSYAQRALKMGAADFVLKPTDPEELIRVMQRVTGVIDEERSRLRHEQKWMEQMENGRDLLLEKLLTQYMLDQAGDKEQKLLHDMMGDQLQTMFSSFQAALVEWEDNKQSGNVLQPPLWPLIQLLKHNDREEQPLYCIPVHENRNAILRAGEWSLDEQEATKVILGELYEQGWTVTIGISSIHADVNGLASAYHEAVIALQQKSYLGKKRVISYTELDQIRLQEKYGLPNIEQYVRKHGFDHISLQDMAASFHMSESHFSRVFKKYTGVSFIDYIARLRMEKARELLIRPDAKIYEVSQAVGYQDPRYFSQIFRRWTGETPTEYRKRMGLS